VLDAETHVRVLVKGPLACRVNVGRLQGNRLIAIRPGNFDTAVPVTVLHVGAAEDDEARLKLLGIDKEGHETPPPVQDL
jgi:hypothetical protein